MLTYRRLLICVLLAAIPFALPSTTTAQAQLTGLIPTPANDYNALPLFNPSLVRVRTLLPNGQESYRIQLFSLQPLPAKYDLSDYLPTPERQSFSDCVGWAVARGVYSYQLGRSRGRKPGEPYDLFSPRFVYSQINNGSDTGSYIYTTTGKSAVSLLQSYGCATEASCPYDTTPGGWNASASAQARVEASNFKAVDHKRIENLDGIKRAVTQHIPVVIGIYTDEKFQDSTDTSIYSSWTGVHSGRHAICVVGYDDSKQAVKLMNSWGNSWKNDGYCWVAYNMLTSIGEDNWCYEAHAIQVVDDNPPTGVDASGKTYVLMSDGSVTKDGTQIHPAGFAAKITATTDWPYLLRTDGIVFTLFEYPTGPVWKDISSPPMPAGLGGQQVVMFEATTDYLYALTPTGRVYARIPNGGGWHRIDEQQSAVDLRVHENRIVVTTKAGRVFRRFPGMWREQN